VSNILSDTAVNTTTNAPLGHGSNTIMLKYHPASIAPRNTNAKAQKPVIKSQWMHSLARDGFTLQ
jgi:hypothetical protein